MTRVALALGALMLWAQPAMPLAPAELLKQIRSPQLDGDRAVHLRGVQVEMGPAVLDIERGILIPVAIGNGRVIEMVFIGQASFRIDPPDDIEAGQLELFTGERTLDASVEEAVLVLANRQAVDRLLSRPHPPQVPPETLERAREIHGTWLEDAERRSAGVESGIFNVLVGDAAFGDYFALWCRSFDRGEFVYQLDPEDAEQITLASFVPLELTHWERRRLRHEIRVQQRKGRWLGIRVQDLGGWDVWLSTPWSPAEGAALPGHVGFESKHYDLDVTIRRGKRDLEGRARIELDVLGNGRRSVRLELMRDLRVQRVVDGRDRELFFYRSGDEIVVLLEEPSRAGETLELVVDYGGQALQWAGGNAYAPQHAENWYPHCGTIDRATYDVRFRWSAKRQIVASGRLVEEGQDGRYRWQRRRLDQPSIAFSFVFGDFLVDSMQAGHVDLTMAFYRNSKARLKPEVRAEAMRTVARALEYFESTFGPYPMDELTVVTLPRDYSTSFASFIILTSSLMEYYDFYGNPMNWVRDTTIAHEVAHQWWGNRIGWASYRDQWLSEGMANYAALMYDSHVASGVPNMLGLMSSGWRESLVQTTREGRTVESLGPIVLGSRLNSSKASDAFRLIVYRKGAAVLAMLARAVGQERFHEMLGNLVQAASDRVLTTDAFLKSIQRMSGIDLEGFAGQYVYGTGIPQVFYGYDLQPSGGGSWKVRGEAEMVRVPHYRFAAVRQGSGWDLRREVSRVLAGDSKTLMVPFRIMLERAADAYQDPPVGRTLRNAIEGQLFLDGPAERFDVETADRPLDLRLDPRGEILARFHSEALEPKRVLRFRAENLLVDGHVESAEMRFLEALGVGNDRRDGRREDARIRLTLARLYLDQGREADAAALLDEIRRGLDDTNRHLHRMSREVLESRIEMRRGDFAAAYRRLKKTLRIVSPRNERDAWHKQFERMQLRTERAAVAEGFGLLAIAARQTGHRVEFEWAAGEARSRGVDLSAFLSASR